MDKKTWKIEKDLCRCCHSEGSFRNLAEPCLEMGEEEVYCDMLRDSFDIDLTPVPGNLCAPTYTICEMCIERLRDASTFKKQVVDCEKKFREMYSKNIIIAAGTAFLIDVKQEPDPVDDLMKYETTDGADSDDDKASLGIKNDDSGDSDDEDDFKLSLLGAAKEAKKKSKASQKKTKTPKAKKQPKRTKTKKEKPTEDGDKEGAEEKTEKKEPKRWIERKYPLSKVDFKMAGGALICAICDLPFRCKESLRYHVTKCHVNKFEKYQCPNCMQRFCTRSQILDHKLKEHNVDHRFKCNACEASFVDKRFLERHMDSFHKLGPKFNCQFCDYESYSPLLLKKHMIRHQSSKDFQCGYCKKSFKRRNTLREHEKIHTGTKNKVCKECGQAFVQKASLNYHMSKYHPEVNF